MVRSQAEMLAKLDISLKGKTGKCIAEWAEVVKRARLEDPDEQVNWLEKTHGLRQCDADLICQTALRRPREPRDEPLDLLANQFSGKRSLRPIYESIVSHVVTLGFDAVVVPTETNVALRRSRHFATIIPAAPDRLDLALSLKDVPETDRLIACKTEDGCTHTVALTDPGDVDDDVKAWLQAAYDMAG